MLRILKIYAVYCNYRPVISLVASGVVQAISETRHPSETSARSVPLGVVDQKVEFISISLRLDISSCK